jgi:hypothetical protein
VNVMSVIVKPTNVGTIRKVGDLWESEGWDMTELRALSQIGNLFLIHESQKSAAHFGGVVVGVRQIEGTRRWVVSFAFDYELMRRIRNTRCKQNWGQEISFWRLEG